jgi:hypothetical protein
MAEGDKDKDKHIEKTKAPQALNGTDKDEMELVTIKLARETVDNKYPPDLPLDVGFVAQVPFIIV